MKRTNKKGFTIVELVIVIAVIAILAAVLIPNISKLVQKANTSADESLVRNLNTALSMDVEKHTTMSAALKAAKDNGGYDLETIELKGKGNKILWDSVNDCFVYLKGTDRVYLPNTQSVKKASEMKDYEYFEIVKEVPAAAEQKYSIYLAGSATIETVTVSVGFDVGNNTVKNVIYTNETAATKTVIIATNSFDTVIKVNAEKDVVKHFGDVKEVNIAKIAPSSYHEFGTVSGNINLAYGKVELESGSSVSNIVIKAIDNVTPTSENVKVSVADNAKANLVISEVQGVSAAVSGAGASNVSKVDDINGKVAIVNGVAYDKFSNAVSKANDNDVITLIDDVTCLSFNPARNIVIDLNGHKFNISSCISVSSTKELTMKNGVVKSTAEMGFYVPANAGLRLSNVDFSAGVYGIYPAGDASFVDIYNSRVQAVVGVATNADGKSSNNVKVNIDSSIIDCGETAIWTNIPSNYTINRSTLIAGCQAVMVRAGTVVISNSEIVLKAGTEGTVVNDKTYLEGTSAWGTGNNIPRGALIVGDYNGSYNNTATCTLINTKVSTTFENWTRALIVLSQDGANATIFNYDADCAITEKDYLICDITVAGLKKGLITVNGITVREREQ